MLRNRLYFILTLQLMASISFGQINTLRQAQTRMDKGKWQSAKELLIKSLKKDTASGELKFGLAQWYFQKLNPDFQLDSAYHYSVASIRSFSQLSGKQKYRLQRNDFDSLLLISFREKIDSAALVRAKELNTELAYNEFINRFRNAKQQAAAVELRDEVGFLGALKINTWKSFQSYLVAYPQSHRREEAEKRFHKLLFDDKTKDHRLGSYQSFVKEFPSNPFTNEANQQIFELSTAGGSIESFLQFINSTTSHTQKKEARHLVFHLLLEQNAEIPKTVLNDSLRKILRANKGYWIPFFSIKKFGFIDSLGQEVMPARFDFIKEDYLCGNLRSDVLITSEGLFNRLGLQFAKPFKIVEDIGSGFLKVGDSSCFYLIHKSGKKIFSNCWEDIKLVGGFLALKEHNLWGLYTFAGRQIMAPTWQDIQLKEEVLIFNHLEKKTLFTPAQLAQSINGGKLTSELVFDEVRSIGKNKLLVRNGALEGILDSQLSFTVALARQRLQLTPYGLVRMINSKFTIAGLSAELENETWDKITPRGNWLLLQKSNEQRIFNLVTKKLMSQKPDSIWVDKGLLFFMNSDSISVHNSNRLLITVAADYKINFIKSKDSVLYFFTENKNKKNVYDIKTGEKLFSSEFNQIESFSPDVFLITRKNKSGLLTRNGKILLSIEYDVILQSQTHYASLYKEKKFGLYNLQNGKVIKPLYDRNVVVLTKELVAASKDKKYAVIDWNGKAVTPFEFSDIQPWSQTEIWVKKNNFWQLMNLATNKIILDKISEIKILPANGDQIAQVRRGSLHGLISRTSGIIIPISFSGIVNVGSDEYPIYFTEKEVKEADIHVIIYYDWHGKLLKKVICEAEEFDQIYCEGN